MVATRPYRVLLVFHRLREYIAPTSRGTRVVCNALFARHRSEPERAQCLFLRNAERQAGRVDVVDLVVHLGVIFDGDTGA